LYALSDYQVVARDFLLDRQVAGLFDVPGVGKTPPTIVAAAEKVAETDRPSLVTAPAYLLPNWEVEISRFAPFARVLRADGAGRRARSAAFDGDADFILTSYNNWSAQHKVGEDDKGPIYEFSYPQLVSRGWSSCVFDEGHRLRGRNSKSTRQVFQLRRRLSANAETPLWCLTGTPIVNNPGDLFPLLHLWRPRDYRSYWKFVNRYCEVVETPWAKEVGKLRADMAVEFRELLAEFSLRRTLEDIPFLSALEHSSRDYIVTLPASVRKMFGQARKEYILDHPDLAESEFVDGGGALYSRLRQLATIPPTSAKPKVDFVLDFLQDHFGPLVVYTWYKSSARGVAEALSKTKRPVTLITGDVPTNKRAGMVDKWKNDAQGIIVATISALKEGISLVNATDVVFLEHSPLPADQEQCIARLKRRGQNSLVNVHNVFANGTPDTAIRRSLEDRNIGLKRALTDWLMED
jgi:SNF2 family DNA or RNA helicase